MPTKSFDKYLKKEQENWTYKDWLYWYWTRFEVWAEFWVYRFTHTFYKLEEKEKV